MRHADVSQQGPVWAVLVTALVLLLIVTAGVWQFWLLEAGLDRQRDLVTISVAQRDALLQMVNEETGVRGYLVTGNPQFLQIYYASLPQWRTDASIVRDNMSILRTLQPAIREAQTLADSLQQYFTHEVGMVRTGRMTRARGDVAQGKALFDRFRAAEALVERQTGDELQTQRQRTHFLARAGFIAGLVVGAVLIAATIFMLVLMRRTRAYRLISLRDSLTGVSNRRGAMSAIKALVGASPPKPFGLVFIDLDGFKKINDSYGHAAGDAILQSVASRLSSELRDSDEVCRLGGDEFVCVVSPPTSLEQLRTIAQRLRKTIAQPYAYGDDYYVIGCSVGLSLYPDHGKSVESLLQRADDAMYAAKTAGGGVREPA